jgi:hypothetical protein
MGTTQIIALIALIAVIGISVYRGVFQKGVQERRNKANSSEKKDTAE